MRLRVLLLLCLVLLAGCKEELYTGLSEREANEMMALLARQGIEANRVKSADRTYALEVEEDQFADAVSILSAYGYPKRQYMSLGDVFTGENLISSPLEEKARLTFALSQELSRTISEIDGVLSARVHLVLPESPPYQLPGNRRHEASASVLIRHDENVEMGSMIPKIKAMIANSIEGLEYENVSIVLFPVNMLRSLEQVRTPEAGVRAQAGADAAAMDEIRSRDWSRAGDSSDASADAGGDFAGVAAGIAGVVGGLLVAVAVFFLLTDWRTRTRTS